MKNFRSFILLLTCMALVLQASQSLGKSPSSYEDIEIPPLDWQPLDYQEFTLPNGIPGILVEDHEVPMVDFYISFASPADPPEKVGLSSLTSWTLRNGGGVNIPADSLNDLIEFKAAGLSIGSGQERLWFYGSCLSSDLPVMLELSRELMDNPAYPEAKIELRKSTMKESIRRKFDRPQSIAFRELSKLLYPDHPWGRETSEETIDAIVREDLLGYHRQVFQPQTAVFGVSGDITLDELRMLASTHFGDLTSEGSPIPALPKTVKPAEPGIYYGYKDAPQAFITFGHQTFDYSDPRRHAATIMNYVLGGGGFQSVLMKRIRVDEGLAYSVWSSFSAPVPVVGRFMSAASTRLDQAGRTLTLMDEIIRNYRENGPTEEEFANAKQAFLNSFVWKYETAEDILGRLVYYKWRGLPLDTPQRDLEVYQALTLDDVKAAARELLQPDNLIKVVVGDEEKMDKKLSEFGEVHKLKITHR